MKNKYTKLILSLVTVAILITGLFGCTSQATRATTRTVTNADGTTIVVPAEVERVAALYGPSYEKIVLLGGEDKIVMRGFDNQSMWPWADVIYKRTKEVPVIPGSAQTPNTEDLLNNKVQVCFFWTTADQIKKMSDSGIPCVYSSSGKQAFDEVKNTLDIYAAVLGGDAPAKSKAYAAYFDKKKKFITDRTANLADSEKPTVYYAVRKILQTAGKTSQIQDVVTLAGGRCVTAGLDIANQTDIPLEQLLDWNPDFIIIDHCGSTTLGSAPAEQTLVDISGDARYQNIKAVQTNQVYISPTGVFFWDAGVQSILQLEWLAKLLHPDLFQDLNMAQELKDFYATFFQYELTDEQANMILLHEPPPSN